MALALTMASTQIAVQGLSDFRGQIMEGEHSGSSYAFQNNALIRVLFWNSQELPPCSPFMISPWKLLRPWTGICVEASVRASKLRSSYKPLQARGLMQVLRTSYSETTKGVYIWQFSSVFVHGIGWSFGVETGPCQAFIGPLLAILGLFLVWARGLLQLSSPRAPPN